MSPSRYELVGAPDGRPLPQRVAHAQALLDAAVEPRWRRDIEVTVRTPEPAARCAVDRCHRPRSQRDLCSGHSLRWHRAGRPSRPRFIVTTDHILRGHHRPAACAVPGCRFGRAVTTLCTRHATAWTAAGRPLMTTWVGTVAAEGPIDAAPFAATCRLPHCDRLVDTSSGYCHAHDARWRSYGRPDAAVFEAEVLNYGDPRWDFRRLSPQLQLELQYGVQRDVAMGFARSSHAVSPAVRFLLADGATTLLEHDRAEWTRRYMARFPGRNNGNNGRAFVVFALEQLTDLMEGAGWDNEYPRPVWQLRRLGYLPAGATRNLNFVDITQPWLVDCAKRWLHWRLTVESKSINTVTADIGALTRLSTYLTETGQAQHSIRGLTRPVLEGHIAWLHTLGTLGASSIRDAVSVLAVFLRALQDHEDWAPDLPRSAVIYSSDYPRIEPLRSRGLSNHVMTQVRAHLPQWRHPGSRFLTYLMLGTGLRIGDACKLPFDPVVFDADNNPYVHYWNHKMRREAYVPISAATLTRITTQQAATTARFPDQVAAYLATAQPRAMPQIGMPLTTAAMKNSAGLRPFHASTYNMHAVEFATTFAITDDAGRPAILTAHRWRHTFASDLINRGVRLEVVKQLLDHSSLEMSAHYARLLDTTMRAEWAAGHGDNPDDDYGHLLPADVEWANRARTALPNGHCGLPRQQSCDHSNKCLACPVFITAAEDLPAHEDQRRRTLTLIAQFDGAGHTKLADQNRVVLEQLDTRIAQIRTSAAATRATSDAASVAGAAASR